MRSGFCLLLFAAACSSAPPEEPLTADSFTDMFIASYVTPTPATILAGVDLPLHTGDRVIANCAQAYAYTLPEMTIDEQAEFNANVTCVYPPQESFDASYRHYALGLRERGFEDDTGDYVQSGMRIACNQTHTVVMGIQSNFVPSFVVDPETDEVIDTPGGGGLANMALAFTVSDRPCERYAAAALKAAIAAQPPAPDGYASFTQPLFVEPAPGKISWGGFEIVLRPQDRVVAHCAQYYSEEIAPYLAGSDFGHWNHYRRCIYPPEGELVAASAYYAEQLKEKGLTGTAFASKGDPAAEYPPLRAGAYEWHGVVYFCDQKRLIGLDAMARFGSMVMLDPLTGEFWSTIDATGGRRERLGDSDYPHQVLVMFEHGLPCDL